MDKVQAGVNPWESLISQSVLDQNRVAPSDTKKVLRLALELIGKDTIHVTVDNIGVFDTLKVTALKSKGTIIERITDAFRSKIPIELPAICAAPEELPRTRPPKGVADSTK